MEAWQILLIIIAIVVFIYLSAIFIILTHAFDFNSRLKRRLIALNIILYEKRSLLLQLIEKSKKEGAIYPEEENSRIDALGHLSFKKVVFEETKNAISLLKSIQSRVSYIISSNEQLKNDSSVLDILNIISDLDRNIRTSCSLYNSDVQGYNYWIAVPGFHWLFFIFRKKPRSLII